MTGSNPIGTGRVVAAPFAHVAVPVVDPEDIAEVAAVVLRENGHQGRTYVLTRPEPVTPRQRVTAISKAIGAPITFIEQSRAEARESMLPFMPSPVVDGTLDILGDPHQRGAAGRP
jgi:uncharacterized protein YbjT (DUF2867 family)